MWPMLNPHLFTVGRVGCLCVAERGRCPPDCCTLAAMFWVADPVLPRRTWVLVHVRGACMCLEQDVIWRAEECAMLAIVCLVTFRCRL